MSKGKQLLSAIAGAGIEVQSASGPTEISSAMMERVAGGSGGGGEHDQFYQSAGPDGGGAFWKSIWRTYPV